jgi:hypothetical protein
MAKSYWNRYLANICEISSDPNQGLEDQAEVVAKLFPHQRTHLQAGCNQIGAGADEVTGQR